MPVKNYEYLYVYYFVKSLGLEMYRCFPLVKKQ